MRSQLRILSFQRNLDTEFAVGDEIVLAHHIEQDAIGPENADLAFDARVVSTGIGKILSESSRFLVLVSTRTRDVAVYFGVRE